MKFRSCLLAAFSGMAILAGCSSEGTEEIKPAAAPAPAPAPEPAKGAPGVVAAPPANDMEKPKQ